MDTYFFGIGVIAVAFAALGVRQFLCAKHSAPHSLAFEYLSQLCFDFIYTQADRGVVEIRLGPYVGVFDGGCDQWVFTLRRTVVFTMQRNLPVRLGHPQFILAINHHGKTLGCFIQMQYFATIDVEGA